MTLLLYMRDLTSVLAENAANLWNDVRALIVVSRASGVSLTTYRLWRSLRRIRLHGRGTGVLIF